MDISIIIPSYNERESLPELVEWIERVTSEEGWSHEIIIVDDGSTDGSWKTIKELAGRHPELHGISFRRNYG